MRITEIDGGLEIRAPAKLNLFLDVLGKREDGYHEIDTVMQAVDLEDRLTIRPSTEDGVRLSCSGMDDVPAGEENLVVRAARRVIEAAAAAGSGRPAPGPPGGFDIHLEKRIPMGGGLGGGSSDAAATIVGVDRLLGAGLPIERLAGIAAGIGSDVPFFLAGGAARCLGRGEWVRTLPRSPAFTYIVVWTGVHCSTAEVYSAINFSLTQKNQGATFVVSALADNDPVKLGEGIYNRLEEAVARVRPELADLRRTLETFPFLGVGLTGSGSCYFGLLDPGEREEETRKRVAETTGHRAYCVRGLERRGAT